MAIDMCSESLSLNTSPRISFSHDLGRPDPDSVVVPIQNYPYRSDSSLLDPNHEFDFCITDATENETSSADELFSDGRIRPLQLQQRFVPSNSKQVSLPNSQPMAMASLPPLSIPKNGISKQERFKEIATTSTIEYEQKPQSKSFWKIRRSSSVHCDNSYKKSSFWSLPLLSRSNSTGSVPIPKQTSKDGSTQKQNSQKQLRNSMSMSSSSSSTAASYSFYTYPLSQKPPLKKNYGGSYGTGVRISPVLNVAPPYISKGTANLFGLGSLFRNGKDKKNKK